MVSVVTVVGADTDLLPHMLSHYKSLGVESFYIHIHAKGVNDPIIEQIVTIADKYGASIASVNVVPWAETVNPILYRQTLQRSSDDWFILADQDELHGYHDSPAEIVKYCERHGYDYVEGCFVDRVAESGTLGKVMGSTPITEQFPLGACITGPILRAVINKVVLARGSVKISYGQHHAYTGVPCPVSEVYVPVYHFKWTDRLLRKLKERITTQKGIQESVWVESQRFVDFYEAENRIPLDDHRLMVAPCRDAYPYWEMLRAWREAAPYFRRF